MNTLTDYCEMREKLMGRSKHFYLNNGKCMWCSAEEPVTEVRRHFVWTILRKVLLIAVCLMFSSEQVGWCSSAKGIPILNDENAVRAVLGEASNQGYEGMLAVACSIRNRANLRGIYGLKNYRASYNYSVKLCDKKFKGKKLSHCKEQAQKEFDQLVLKAEQAWRESQSTDVVLGADHWENIKAFGVPSWAKEMKKTVSIGDHTFYKSKRAKERIK